MFESSLIGIWWFTIGLLIFSHRNLIFPHPPRKYALATWHFFDYCYYGYYYYDDYVIWYAHIQVDPDKPQPKLRGHLEGTLYQCKGCSFSRSKPHYCQVVSDVFCGLAHNVGKRWLSFIARAVLSARRSRTIAKHTGFRGFLWVGSSCWEEVTLFHCKSCAFIRSKPRYCQTHWFQRFFGSWCWEKVTFYRCKSLSWAGGHYQRVGDGYLGGFH